MMMKSNSSRERLEEMLRAGARDRRRDEFDLGAGKIARRRNEREPVDRGRQMKSMDVGVAAGERLVDRAARRALAFSPTPLVALPCGSQSTSRTLRPQGEGGGEIDGRGGLADAALLIGDGDNLSHIS